MIEPAPLTMLRMVPSPRFAGGDSDGVLVSKADVQAKWRETLFLREAGLGARGWLIEVLKCVERIGSPSFTLDDVYGFEAHLSALYPGNANVRPKIRQQLQVLRDRGLIEFLGRGRYRMRAYP